MSDSEYAPPSASAFPPVLDACCGSRAFWFDKADQRCLYVDKRSDDLHRGDSSNPHGFRTVKVRPDMLADFTNLPFPSDTFALVVFDPPHLASLGQTSYMAKTYGVLLPTWRDDLRAGFAECFRVLRPEGTLIFKWCDIEIPLSDVLALTPHKPLFGHRRKDNPMNTHWVAFLKPNSMICLKPATETTP
jgi:SAM-dependent methyltransferase